MSLPTRSRRRWAVAIGAAAVAAAAGLTVGLLPAGAHPAAPSGPYVALGDSYTAGPLVATQEIRAGLCLRSDHNYPSLVARALHSSRFTDVSCSGATTADLTHAQTPQADQPQLAALRPDTALVTLGIGGNDIGFSGIALTCAAEGLLDRHGSPCTAHYRHDGTDQLADRIAATGPKVAAVLHAIQDRSPHARVLVVGYPDLLPTTGDGCWPAVPFASGDLPYLRTVQTRLNAMLASTVAHTGASYVDTYRSSVGHDLCQSSSRKWIEGVLPTHPAAPIHPNAAGLRNDAAQVLAALRH